MQLCGKESGSVKLGVPLIVGVLAVAGFAGAVMFRSSSAGNMEAASAVPVKGSSFSEAPQVPPATSSAPDATPAPVAALETPAAVSQPTVAEPAKAATAADVPIDIAKIPSATPVQRYEVVSNAAGGSPPPSSQPAAPAPPPANAGDFKEFTWQILAGYKYEEPVPREGAKPEEMEAERKKNQIPADVVALNGSKAMVEGWMVPMQVDDNGGVKTFVLVKTQPQCCFGDTQKMNEWIDVAMPDGKTAEFNVDRPIKVYGQLEVGEKVEDGFVLSIYRMKADKVSG